MRLFAAIELPAGIKQELAAMCAGVPGAKWVDEDAMHLTLRFIGEVDGGVSRDIGAALDRVEAISFDLRLKGVGQFGQRRRVRQLWAGVEAEGALEQLQRRIESALTALGLEPERRKFHPHVTLARLKNAPIGRVADFLSNHGPYVSESFRVDSFVLFSSQLSASGALHRVEATYGLSDVYSP